MLRTRRLCPARHAQSRLTPDFFSLSSEAVFFLIYLGFFSLSVLTGEKIADCLQLLCSTETRKSEKSKAFTATFLVCITDVAQMMCMFYI